MIITICKKNTCEHSNTESSKVKTTIVFVGYPPLDHIRPPNQKEAQRCPNGCFGNLAMEVQHEPVTSDNMQSNHILCNMLGAR